MSGGWGLGGKKLPFSVPLPAELRPVAACKSSVFSSFCQGLKGNTSTEKAGQSGWSLALRKVQGEGNEPKPHPLGVLREGSMLLDGQVL